MDETEFTQPFNFVCYLMSHHLSLSWQEEVTGEVVANPPPLCLSICLSPKELLAAALNPCQCVLHQMFVCRHLIRMYFVFLHRKFAQRSPTDLAADHPEVLTLLTRYKVTSETSRGQGDGAPGGTERKVSTAAVGSRCVYPEECVGRSHYQR